MLSRKELKTRAKEQLKGQWGSAVLVMLFQIAISIILSLVSDRLEDAGFLGFLFSLATIVVGWILTIAITNYFFKLSRWNNMKFKDIFVDSTIIGKGLLVNLLMFALCIPVIIVFVVVICTTCFTSLMGIIQFNSDFEFMIPSYELQRFYPMLIKLGIIMLVFMIVMMIIGVFLAQANLNVVENPERGTWACIKESCMLMKGHFWQYVVLQLSFIGWALLCILSIGIGFLWLFPYIHTTNSNFYNELKGYNKEEFEPLAIEDFE